MSTPSILVVDDDATIRDTLSDFFDALGFRVRVAATATEARRFAATDAPDLALIDLRLPDADGLTLQQALLADDPGLGVVLLTAHADVATAVRAMRQGAVDFLEKPVDLDALEASVRRALEIGQLRREVGVLRARRAEGASPTAQAPSIDRLVDLAARKADAPVLIVGETVTGKGYLARQIHDRSPQHDQPFVEINCASLSATFFESELFGHEKGAFTDARQAKRGLLEVAGGGTVFLDEIGELAPAVQPKLLKVIEDRTFRRLGGTAEHRAACRIVVATNRPLSELVGADRFRADLFYRLQVLSIELPPLRDHRDRIPALVAALLPRGATVTSTALAALQGYRWPGNVRELKNTLWRAALLADGAPIEPAHLGLGAASPSTTDATAPDAPATLADAERAAIGRALRATGGNRVRAAQILGIARSTLIEKLRRLDIDGRPPESDAPTQTPNDR